ncbi:MAG: HAMP domain-containing protein [Deltaproteobacteria bacterium]|nr:HAMP domain-containing protein [Deltaproteobacteria bacterium]
MTLRLRTLIVFTASLAGLVLVLYFVVAAVLHRSYAELEDRDARKNLARVQAALRERVAALNLVVGDWAPWDDSYAFVQDGDAEFVRSNLDAPTLANLAVSAVVYVAADGRLVFGRGFDQESETLGELPRGLAELLGPGGALLGPASASGGLSGVLALPDGPLLIAAQPILRSDRTGPSPGVLAMARPLAEAQIAELTAALHVELAVDGWAAPAVTATEEPARRGLSSERPDAVVPIGEQRMAGLTLVADVFGRPALVVRALLPREIHEQGRADLRYLLFAIIGVGVAITLIGVLLLDTVLRRLTKVSRQVVEVGSSADSSRRLPPGGKDELGRLAAAINGMLEALQQSQARLREQDEAHRRDLELKVRERTADLAQLNVALEATVAEMQRARGEAERANRAKSEFLSRMSHELRTPLNAILGFGQLLQGAGLSLEQHRNADDIVKAGRHLLQLVDEVLDLARIESGRSPTSLEPVRAGDVLAQALELVRPTAERHEAKVEVPEPASFSRCVLADRRRLLQVLINLLSNALKYGGRGGTVTAECREATAGCLRLSVRDSGPGIPPALQERLFVPFERLGAEKGEIDGIGLGLSLSKRFVEAMGGTIGLDSPPGQGSTFWVELPEADDPEPSPAPNPDAGRESA